MVRFVDVLIYIRQIKTYIPIYAQRPISGCYRNYKGTPPPQAPREISTIPSRPTIAKFDLDLALDLPICQKPLYSEFHLSILIIATVIVRTGK